MVKVACPVCAKTMRFQEKYLGRKVHCPGCGHPQVLSHPNPDDEDTHGPPPTNAPKPLDRSQSFATQMPATMAIDRGSSGNGHRKPVLFAGSFLAPPEAPDEIGRLGGYRILSQLGAGGMGVVFLAEDAKLNRKIAVKALPPDALDDPSARDRFKREAEAAAKLDHENIVTIYHVGEDRGIMFLAMQLLKGQPLDQYLAESEGRPLPSEEVLQIGREIAAGLSAAHEQNLIHRDIKPANVWLEDLAGRSSSKHRFRVKILDFGLARRTHDASLTQSGIIVGTPSYMSPEQARGPKVDGRSDIFSLGCVLYECATGRRPFPGDDAISVLSSLAADAPLPPAEINPEIPFELSDFILELLEKNPTHRPATARDVEDRLQEIGAAATDTSSQTAKLPISKLRPIRKAASSQLWIWISAGAVAACVLIAVGAWAVVSSSTPPPVKEKVANPKKDVKPQPKEVIVIQQPPFQPPPFPDDDFKKKQDDEFKRLKDKEKELLDLEKQIKDRERDMKDKENKKDWKDPNKKGKKGMDKDFGPPLSFHDSRPMESPALERRSLASAHFVSRQTL